jgi:hypothetical protein
MDCKGNSWCKHCKSEWQRQYRAGVRRQKRVPDPILDENGCLIWQGYKMPNGYGRKSVSRSKCMYAHRWAYEQVHGPIGEALVVDHLCGNRACVNVEHMEVVTIAENTRRGAKKRWANGRS